MSERSADGIAYLKFDHPNVGYVIDGKEDATVRVGFERDWEPGQVVQLRTPKNNVFGYAEVQGTYESRVEQAHFDICVADRRNHPAESDDDLLERLRSHYPDESVQYDTPVTVVNFDLFQVGGARHV